MEALMKIICLSFDDGTIYYFRFIELLNKYGLKATLNLNSGLESFVWYYNNENAIRRLELRSVEGKYVNHEVAAHSLTHPYLSSIFGYRVVGFAFPFHDLTKDNIINIKDNVCLSYIRYSCLKNDYIPSDCYYIHINALYDGKYIKN